MLKTFPLGGVHPPENKLTCTKPIRSLPIPQTVYVPIAQHIGIPSEIVVEVKQKVEAGQMIAKSGGYVSSSIHSPVAGTVTKLDKIIDSSGYKKQCIVIRSDAAEIADRAELPLKTEIEMDAEAILNQINSCGIVGLGGATFPSFVKLHVDPKSKIDTLLINGVECEPYLTADHSLMLAKAPEIVVGIHILLKALGIQKAIIGIEANKQDAIQKFLDICKGNQQIQVAALKVKYPQGGEKQLIKALLNREVPKGGLPHQVGVIVHNVGTIFAIYEAVQHHKPLTDRVVTVTGKKVKDPGNFWVKIGTPIKDLIDAVGGMPTDTRKILNGGPMMGKALKNLDVPVTKGTSGIVMISDTEAERETAMSCIKCARCISVCPMGLEPYLLMDLVEKNRPQITFDNDVMTCIECGSCSYICPSHRPLLDYIRYGKDLVKKLELKS
jgi:Na+-translocating ferredoxin:NAD+ oxidoreductase subunit C